MRISSARAEIPSLGDSDLFRISIFEFRVSLLVRILGADGERDSAARGELRSDDHLARGAGFDEIVENSVCYCFIKRVHIAIRREIKFQRFALDTETIGHVIDVDSSKIGLTGYRANGSEIIRFEVNVVIAARRWIWECLKPCLGR